MLCVSIVYISGGTYSLKSAPNDRFFEKLFITILLRVYLRKYNFVYFGLTSNKPTHYLLDYGDFNCSQLYVTKKNCFSLLFLCSCTLHKQLLHNYSKDLCNVDLQTSITLFKCNVSSHKMDWTSPTQSPALPRLFYGNVNSLMRRIFMTLTSRNLFKYIHRCCYIIVSFL